MRFYLNVVLKSQCWFGGESEQLLTQVKAYGNV